MLSRRRPSSAADTPRRENDNFRIVSGVFNNKTTGSPVCIIIPNESTQSKDYQYGLARPSHADYSAFCKYHGYEDYRGGGHFSGRITAALVAAGGIVLPALEELGIKIDLSKNDFRGQDRDITADGAKIKTLVLTTNEELEIARDTYRIVSEQK